MRRRVVGLSFLVSGLSLVGVLGWVGYRDHRAAELTEAAMERLQAPLAEAPGLDRIQASTAVSLLERARDYGRTDPETEGWLAYAQALEDFQRGDLLLAEGELTSARHRLGTTTELLVLGAAVAHGMSRPDDARRLLAQALRRDADSLRGHLLAADLDLDSGDAVGALAHLTPILERSPGVAVLHNRHGLALELQGNDGEASQAYVRAVELDARFSAAWINLGRLHRRRGEHMRALEAFDRAVQVDDTNADAHLGRGLARAAQGRLDLAREDFERAAELAPNDAEPLLALGDLLRDLRRYDDAVEAYQRGIAREDADAASWLKLGNVLTLLERYEEAARSYRSALRRGPQLAAAHNGLGAALMHLGDQAGATRALDRAASLDVQDPNPFMNLALLHERGGDLEAARLAWRAALERDPGSRIARARLARL